MAATPGVSTATRFDAVEASLVYLRALRARLGARWCVVALLIPVAISGVLHFGARAGLVLLLTVATCSGLSIAMRVVAGQPWRYFNAGTVVTGLLLGLTFSADTPIYMILVGAAVAELVGKYRLKTFGTNPFNPAALGRAAVALLELAVPAAPGPPDIVSTASPLQVAAGGGATPELWSMLIGATPGAIGETSAGLLAAGGLVLVVFVAEKREATLAMLGATVFLVLVLPPTIAIHGHAPWVLNPIVYLAGGPAFLYVFFFATDPATTPNTRRGGLIFGVGCAGLGVLARLYSSVPGPEMWAILIMNALTPALDRALGGHASFAPLPGGAQTEGVRSFYQEVAEHRSAPPQLVVDGVRAIDPGSEERFGVLGSVIGMPRSEIVARIAESGLCGCGGARFPVAIKWNAVLAEDRPRILVVNGQEGEPDSFKDRVLMVTRAELVVEGVAIAAHVIDAREIHLVHPPEDPQVENALAAALSELATTYPRLANRITLVAGSGLYVCGEESALLSYLEGERGEPRMRPPHPSQCGLHGRPTLVHNVETVSWLPRLLAHPDEGFEQLPNLVSVSGAVSSPGVYSVEFDVTVQDLVKVAGGPLDVAGFAVGGPTGDFLPESAGMMLVSELPGTRTVRVIGSDGCPVAEALTAARFASRETCGRCTPCRVGCAQLARMWGELARGQGNPELPAAIEELGGTVTETSACGFGRAAPGRVLSVIARFPDLVQAHLHGEESGCKACKKSS